MDAEFVVDFSQDETEGRRVTESMVRSAFMTLKYATIMNIIEISENTVVQKSRVRITQSFPFVEGLLSLLVI